MISLKLFLCRWAIGITSILAWGWAIDRLVSSHSLAIVVSVGGAMGLAFIWIDPPPKPKKGTNK